MSLAGRVALAPYLRWRFEHWSEDRLLDHQQRRLRLLLEEVAKRSPYYRSLIEPETRLADVPMMDKSTMMAEFDNINTAGLLRDELVSFRIRQEHEGSNDLYPGGCSIGLSSGTSGNKVLTVLSPRELDRYSALLLARNGLPRRLPNRKVLFALRTNNPAFTSITRLGVKLLYVDYLQSPAKLIDLINEHRLNVLAGPPSLLCMLAEHHTSIDTPIDAMLSYAEELDPETREQLADTFGAPVAEIYQGAEGMIGSSCRDGRLHLNEDVTFVELEDAGDNLGATSRVIVTDLYRTTQPFIRYQLGDLLEVGGRDCTCGSAFRLIKRIHGRSDGMFLLADSQGGTVRLMPDYVRRSINRASADIIEYQAIQRATDRVEVRLDLAGSADRAAIEETIRSNLTMWCGRADAEMPALEFSDHPPERNERSGKLIRVSRSF